MNPIRPAFALAYAWMPVLLTVSPAADEMLMIRPQPALLHVGHDGARAVERRGEVRVDDRVPVVVGYLLQRMADLAADTAGVVHQDVDGADAGEELATAAGRSGRAQVGATVLVDLVHGRAVVAQRAGDGGADAVRGAGDDRGLAC